MAAPAASSTSPARPAETRPPQLALTVEQAAAALSVSYDTYHEQIEPDLKIVRLGRRKLVAVTELQRWLDDHAEACI
jgi:excisionase family DNA binding protein